MGPTYDHRIKPDIVAPGASLTSARASTQHSNDKTCDTTSKQGTSMATPAAAGAAAMLRQYLQDDGGKFWSKICHQSDSLCKKFTPSGTLLKAMMVHSGDAMTLYHDGNPDKNVELSKSYGQPDNYQGFGRVQLSNVIPLPGKTSFQLTLRDNVDISEKTTMSHHFKVTDSSQPLVVTISWYDPPATSGAAKALVNDLDLILRRPGGKSDLYGNYKKKRDNVNTNERISVKKPKKGNYEVVIEAKALPVAGIQRFAMVLTYAGKPLSTSEIQQLKQEVKSDNENVLVTTFKSWFVQLKRLLGKT